MARPEKVADVKLRTNSIGEIDVNQFKARGAVMRGYGMFLAALEAGGGHIETLPYGSSAVRLSIDKSAAGLRDQLKLEQSEWDRAQADYDLAQTDRFALPSWHYPTVNEWAEAEGLPKLDVPGTDEYVVHEANKAVSE